MLPQAGATGGLDLMTSGREVLPALGLAWANCVNQRIFLARCQTAHSGGGVLRQMRVVNSPYLPQGQRYYVVEQAGVRGLSNAELQYASTAPAAAANVPAHVSLQAGVQWPSGAEMQHFGAVEVPPGVAHALPPDAAAALPLVPAPAFSNGGVFCREEPDTTAAAHGFSSGGSNAGACSEGFAHQLVSSGGAAAAHGAPEAAESRISDGIAGKRHCGSRGALEPIQGHAAASDRLTSGGSVSVSVQPC